MIVQLCGEYSPHMNFNVMHGHVSTSQVYCNTPQLVVTYLKL